MAEITEVNGVWEAILWAIAWVVEKFYYVAQDWGLAIILFTLVFRFLMMPLMFSQSKASFQMQKIQPRIQEIQSRWSGDPMRMQEETQKLYAETKFNPLASCIPMLIQMPIFIALFQVLRNIQDFLPGYSDFRFYNIIPNLLATPSEVIEQGVVAFVPYAILIIIFVGATFLPMLLQQRNSSNQQQKNQMYMMSIIMGIMMLFVSWSSPAGVLLFWGTSGIIATIAQQLYMRHLKRQDAALEAEQIEVQPIKVEVERKVKKKRPTKKR